MKRPSDWPLHFVLYPMIFRICPAPIPAIIQEMSNLYIVVCCKDLRYNNQRRDYKSVCDVLYVNK